MFIGMLSKLRTWYKEQYISQGLNIQTIGTPASEQLAEQQAQRYQPLPLSTLGLNAFDSIQGHAEPAALSLSAAQPSLFSPDLTLNQQMDVDNGLLECYDSTVDMSEFAVLPAEDWMSLMGYYNDATGNNLDDIEGLNANVLMDGSNEESVMFNG